MHSKVLVVDLGEIARAGQDHCSALQPLSKVRQLSGFVYGYTLSHSRVQHIGWLCTRNLTQIPEIGWSTVKAPLCCPVK